MKYRIYINSASGILWYCGQNNYSTGLAMAMVFENYVEAKKRLAALDAKGLAKHYLH